ncbi:MAG: phasin family protein [Proteobacteria bacterium]|nr:phasin family protein [Pseudomonadota bacterium]
MLKQARARAAAQGTESGKAKTAGGPGAASILDSSRQIWLAGLGAFARAQAEGRKVFDALVRQGESVESSTRRAAADTAHAAQARAKEMQKMAGGTWDRLEKVFEDRVARALSRLGVHTQADVDRLSARVDALAEAVNELVKSRAGGGKAVKSRSARKRPAKARVR